MSHFITDIYKFFASHMFGLWMVVGKWLNTKLLRLADSFCCSFRTWRSNVIVNSSLSTTWSHWTCRILVIHSEVMIKFCMWFQNTLRSLIWFVRVLCWFNHLDLAVVTLEVWYEVTLSMASSPTAINITVVNHSTASSSMVASWLLKTIVVSKIMSGSEWS